MRTQRDAIVSAVTSTLIIPGAFRARLSSLTHHGHPTVHGRRKRRERETETELGVMLEFSASMADYSVPSVECECITC